MKSLVSVVAVLALSACGGASSSDPDAPPGTSDATAGGADATVGTTDGPAADAPPCSIGFDETIAATMAVDADDQTRVYLNGTLIDEVPSSWPTPKNLSVTLWRSPLRANVIAIQADNTQIIGGYDRGLVVDLRYTPGGAVKGDVRVVSDATWKVTEPLVADWFAPDHDDAAWDTPIVEGAIGMAPWGDVFSAIAPGSTASWLWLYDSNLPAADKSTAETMFARKTFYLNLRGGAADAPPGCL